MRNERSFLAWFFRWSLRDDGGGRGGGAGGRWWWRIEDGVFRLPQPEPEPELDTGFHDTIPLQSSSSTPFCGLGGMSLGTGPEGGGNGDNEVEGSFTVGEMLDGDADGSGVWNPSGK
ncbi:hypothetical protein ACH5RR_026200 [Cinchona calisaya]|uniref:Uncharacterized protein n=1 Tax=Cinchona calisaya TaxID=153742 RepID=A0ABD2Z6W0_9GENT